MFGLANPQPDDECHAEFKRLTDRMWAQHDCDATPHDELLHAMAVIGNEFTEQHGAGWDNDDHGYYLGLVRERLLADAPVREHAQIKEAASRINQWGEEIADAGKSKLKVKPAIDYLIAQVVNWCRENPQAPN